MRSVAREALDIAKRIQADAPLRYVPPSAGTRPATQAVLPFALVQNTRGYLERVVHQINGSYEKGWFDACAVMMRRLMETLIIECFEAHGIANKIRDTRTGDFFYLSDLVTHALAEPAWNLGRNTKRALPNLKTVGDQSAHSRRYNAHREDIDKLIPDFRTACQELIYLAKLK
ncbi:MAG: hypothetical protein NTZ17_19340 [Phycisphaerae bacterium]|nr:hypothetical protein [Phycisphaerae bacterium]